MRSPADRNLVLATTAFAICFAQWGLISGLAPYFKAEYHLSASETSLLIAIPVLLGAIGRVPAGLLTDRFGGRAVFSALLVFGLIPATALALDHSYPSLLFWGLWLGLAGTSFAVGVGLVSRWFSPERQGFALGIYGAGNIGQSVAVFLGPLLALAVGVSGTFLAFGLVSLAWGVVFALCARDAPRAAPPPSLRDNLRVLAVERLSWVLSLFYFLTFGGFVALGIYLPTLLREVHHLTPQDAGARAAGFIILATVCRPIGGWIADRISGQRLLRLVFPSLGVLGLFMISPSLYLFSVGALGCAMLLGLGNGGVFKLVPRFFPKEAGTVTGLVGAAGGLGGFFPPLVLGGLRDVTGSYAPGFALLSVFALGCALVAWRLPALRPPAPAGPDQPSATAEPAWPRVSSAPEAHPAEQGGSGLSAGRSLSIGLRALYLAASGLVLGGFAWNVAMEQVIPWIGLALLSGAGLILLDIRAVGRSWFVLRHDSFLNRQMVDVPR